MSPRLKCLRHLSVTVYNRELAPASPFSAQPEKRPIGQNIDVCNQISYISSDNKKKYAIKIG